MIRLGKTTICLAIIGVMLNFSIVGLQAQTQPLLNLQNRGAQYLIGNEGELQIKVNIWGFVRIPGQYLVPSDTDLISLISYAGGPAEGAKIGGVKVVRTVNIDSTGKLITHGKKVYEYNIKKYLETGDETVNPQLMPNDTVMISGTTFHLMSKIIDFAAKLGFFVQLYLFWLYRR